MSTLAPGLLVAAPPLLDPNFDRSVVLLAAHGPEGAFGWVINGREVMSFAELLGRAEVNVVGDAPRGAVLIGGPVAQEQVWLIYRSADRVEGLSEQFEVGSQLIASPSRKMLEAIAEGQGPRHLVALMGYAGWAPDQLENEIGSGAWLPTEAHESLVFEVPREEIWRRAYERLGTTPIAFTTRTVGSA